jgi:hypothetical protein
VGGRPVCLTLRALRSIPTAFTSPCRPSKFCSHHGRTCTIARLAAIQGFDSSQADPSAALRAPLASSVFGCDRYPTSSVLATASLAHLYTNCNIVFGHIRKKLLAISYWLLARQIEKSGEDAGGWGEGATENVATTEIRRCPGEEQSSRAVVFSDGQSAR